MEIPVMKTWVDGETVTPQDLNEQIRDVANFQMYDRPFSRTAQQAATQSVPDSVWTPIIFDTSEFDTDVMWSAASADRLTIQTPGVYIVTATVCFAPNATGDRLARLTTNTQGTLSDFRIPTRASGTTSFTVSALSYFSAGETLKLEAYQTSGGALSTSTDPTSNLAAVWMAG